jgi:hexosaminidase
VGPGQGRTAQEAATRGAVADVGRLYLNHILRLHELAARYGRRIQLWGDILLHHPELVSELPDDVTLLDWHYEAADDYPSVRQFAASGRDFWVCPGTSSWNTLFPRIENSNGNIRTLACLGAEHGASGLLNTDWGDHGHYQPIGQCWYGYAFGLEQAWTGGATPDEVFDPRFGRLAFGAPGEAVVATMRDLARLNTLEGMPRPNASQSVYALWDEPLAGESVRVLPPETLREIVRTCTRAEEALCAAMATSRDPVSLEEMAFSARLMAYAATKVAVSQEVRAELQGIAGDGEAARQALRVARERLRALDADLVPLIEEFRALWLRRARYSEMDITLGYYTALRGRYRAVVSGSTSIWRPSTPASRRASTWPRTTARGAVMRSWGNPSGAVGASWASRRSSCTRLDTRTRHRKRAQREDLHPPSVLSAFSAVDLSSAAFQRLIRPRRCAPRRSTSPSPGRQRRPPPPAPAPGRRRRPLP